MRTHGAVVGRRFRSVKKLTTKVRIGRGYLWGVFLLLPQRSKHPQEIVITPKASTSNLTVYSFIDMHILYLATGADGLSDLGKLRVVEHVAL